MASHVYVVCDALHRRVAEDFATREQANEWVRRSGRTDLHVVEKQFAGPKVRDAR
jgi:hypothetical protein